MIVDVPNGIRQKKNSESQNWTVFVFKWMTVKDVVEKIIHIETRDGGLGIFLPDC